jgi:hypothetical protein
MRGDVVVVYLKQKFKESLIFTEFTFPHLQIHRNFTCIGCPASSVCRHFEQEYLTSDERHSYLIISLKLFRIVCTYSLGCKPQRKETETSVCNTSGTTFRKTATIDRKCVIGHTVWNGVWDDGNVCPLQWRNLSVSKNVSAECFLPFTSEYLSSVSYLNVQIRDTRSLV